MPESKNWKKNWQKNVSGGRLPRTIPTVRCGSMKLLQKICAFQKAWRKVEYHQHGHRKLSGADAQMGICTSG